VVVNDNEMNGAWLDRQDVLLHIGVHKTGTTAIQASLAAARSQLRRNGVTYPGRRVSHYLASLAALETRRGWAKGGQMVPAEQWDRLVEDVWSTSDKVVVSSEAICQATEQQARRIVDDLAPERVRVLITLRPLESLLPSNWQQYVKTGLSMRYEQWLEEVMEGPGRSSSPTPSFWTRNDHVALIERWSGIVGAERTCAFFVDDSDRSGLFRGFDHLIGLPEGTLQPDPHAVSNRSLSASEVEVIRQLNEVAAEVIDFDIYNRLLRQGGILDLVENRRPPPDERRLHTPSWAVQRAREHGRFALAKILASGCHVMGATESYVPDGPIDEAPTPPEPDLVAADIAVRLLFGVLHKAVEHRDQSAT